jgi:DHA1 family inner membrane transport protein
MAISAIVQWPSDLAGPALIVIMVIWGVSAWMFPPAQASRILSIAPESAPLALSLNGSALYLGIASGSLFGGLVIANLGLEYLGWIGGAFPLLGLVVMRLASVSANRRELSVA